ncbi:MAG: hypothetical protein Q4E83_01930 [bacterium]|nr:hypothetical protein [bacterium]
MNKIDIKMLRALILVVLLFIVFGAAITKKTQYLPSKENPNMQSVVDVQPNDEIINKDSNTENVQESANENKSETVSVESKEVVSDTKSDLPELDKVTENNSEILDNEAISPFDNAIKLKNEKKYQEALNQFIEIAKNNNDDKLKSSCYEEISQIYALNKKYGTALSYAQKSFNLNPNTRRELLLARLYYKTGDITNATKRVNNILQRDFIVEN